MKQSTAIEICNAVAIADSVELIFLVTDFDSQLYFGSDPFEAKRIWDRRRDLYKQQHQHNVRLYVCKEHR